MTDEAQEPTDAITRERLGNTLAGLSIVREVRNGGAQYATLDGAERINELVDEMNEPTDAHALARLLIGVTNVSLLLLDWIEGEARKKELLLADVRQRLSDYEEPDTYRTDPSWSTWDGVLGTLEKMVRPSPTSG